MSDEHPTQDDDEQPEAEPEPQLRIEDYQLAMERLTRSREKLEHPGPLMTAVLASAEKFLGIRFKEVLGE
ncbi:hypothetical protein JYT84_00325 [bacterium AH-315-M10]|nr:hypothetical protein [bacterium AH-315-M10]